MAFGSLVCILGGIAGYGFTFVASDSNSMPSVFMMSNKTLKAMTRFE